MSVRAGSRLNSTSQNSPWERPAGMVSEVNGSMTSAYLSRLAIPSPAGLASGYSLWVNLKNAEAQGVKLPVTLIEKAADRLWDAQGVLVKGK